MQKSDYSKIKSNLRKSRRIKLLIILATVFLIATMFPTGESIESEVTVGTVWIHDDLIASTTFEILKDKQTYELEKNSVLNKVLPVFVKNSVKDNLLIDSLLLYNTKLLAFLNKQSKTFELPNFLSKQSFNTFIKLSEDQSEFAGLNRINLNSLFSLTREIIENILLKGYLSVAYNEINKDSIAIREGKFEKAFNKKEFYDHNSVNEYINTTVRKFVGNNSQVSEAVDEYLNHFTKPNLFYSAELTSTVKENVQNKVTRNIGIVNENERIIAKHDRITLDKKQKIDSYKVAKGEDKNLLTKATQYVGKSLHILILLLPLLIYIYLFRKKIYYDNLKAVLLASLFLLVSFITYLITGISISSPIEFLIFVPVVSMLLTIIFDSRLGFYSTVTMSLIVGALRGNDYAITVMNIIAGALAAYTVRDIRNRTQIFRSFMYILVGYILSIIAFGLERFETIDEMVLSFAFAGSNALISPVLTYGLIIFVEKIFFITTDLTLLELTDMNRPLLKELAKNAPGTFNHSISMATLAETTAEYIGANAVMAKVGALYHDIGKKYNPESFVENQIDVRNIHENLAPEKSVEILRDHVRFGIELAEKYKLPHEIIDFIPMHHGTMVMGYFYEKAKVKYGESIVKDLDYRYLGPKPNTKETAIVMLADACESTIRSLTDADSQKIERVISNLINSRIEDGQLDESPLTFSDIRKIKDSFFNILVGHHHKRIKYPAQKRLDNTIIDE